MSCLPEDKAAYKTIASKCSDAIKKYHAANELETFASLLPRSSSPHASDSFMTFCELIYIYIYF